MRDVERAWWRRVYTWGRWGVPFGIVGLCVDAMTEPPSTKHTWPEALGGVVGSMVGGWLLFAIVPLAMLALCFTIEAAALLWRAWLGALAQMAAAIRGDGQRKG